MGIMDAFKDDITKSYEYKVGYKDGKEEVMDALDDLLDDITCRQKEYHSRITGTTCQVVDVDVIERQFSKFIERMKKA